MIKVPNRRDVRVDDEYLREEIATEWNLILECISEPEHPNILQWASLPSIAIVGISATEP